MNVCDGKNKLVETREESKTTKWRSQNRKRVEKDK